MRVRDLLKVGVRAGHSSAGRANLPKVRVYAICDGVNVAEQRQPIARKRFLYAAVFEQLRHCRMIFCERLKLPAPSAFDLDAHAGKRSNYLRRAIEVDVRRFIEKRELRNAPGKLAP